MVVRELDPARADRDAWQALADAATDANPFFEPAFVLPAVRHLDGGTDVRLIVAEQEGDWFAAVPTIGTLRWRGVPAIVRGPWSHPYTFLGAPLVAPGGEGLVGLQALLGALRRRSGFVPLELLPAEGATVEAVWEAGAVTEWQSFERAALLRRPQPDYLEGRISSRRRRRLRQHRRQLGERLGEVATTEDEAGVEALLDMEARGWKGRAGTALETSGHGPFLREVGRRFAERGKLHALMLKAGDRPVAAQVNLVAQDAVFCFKTAYDEELSDFSPGVLLELDAIGAFHDRPELARMDSCSSPSNELVNGLWADRLPLVNLLLAGSGTLGRLGQVQTGMLKALRTHVQRRGAR